MSVHDWVGFKLDGPEVTLQGAVTRPRLRQSIERSVRALEAVAAVRNDIEVLPRSGNDIGVRINAYWRIYGHPELRQQLLGGSAFRPRLRRSATDEQRVLLKPVHIVVRDGHLTLEGEVEQQRQKRLASQQASAVLGVRSVTNNLIVTGTDTEEFEPIDFETDPWWTDSDSVAEPVVRVENPAGGVRVRVVNAERVLVRRSSRTRAVQPGDTKITRLGHKMRIRSQPPDGASIDLEVDLPYGHRLEVQTVGGPIALTGLVRRARLETDTGKIELAVPWRAVRLSAEAYGKPRAVALDGGLHSFFQVRAAAASGKPWAIVDRRDAKEPLYGSVQLDTAQPEALVLREAPIPGDSPVRLHWQAPEVLAEMLRRPFRMRLTQPGTGGGTPEEGLEPEQGIVQFNSEVRLVQLLAAVVDAKNRPVMGLGPQSFQILEDGAEQRIGMVRDTETEFNLVLLLDCSTSTLADRESVLEAARRFIRATRPADRVGIYVLSDAFLHVVSPLTPDRETLLSKIERIPRLSGGTPLYDAITLAYAQELAHRRWERNALIVISDGMDNDLQPGWSRMIPSQVPFQDLLRVSAEINSAIYPIFLEPDEPGIRTERSWREALERATSRARERMRKLAEATGGRLFRAESLGDLDTVYQQVADELRSVYTLAYYPSNQDFDGAWRRIRVVVRSGDARVRTRPGYYGW